MTEITDAVPHELRNLLIGALLDCIDDNMLAEHYADVERLADDAIRAVSPMIAAQSRPREVETVRVAVGKVVQIAVIPANNGIAAAMFILRNDGTVWGKRVDVDNARWWQEPLPPGTVTLPLDGKPGHD